MIVAALIYRSPNPSVQLTFCVIGIIAGIALFLQGFRLLRRHRVGAQLHQSVEPIDVASHRFALPRKPISVSVSSRDPEVSVAAMSQHLGLQPEPHLEVVRLSTEPTPAKASEMSQQQKIAAALFMAGMSIPALRAAAELPANGGVQVLNTPTPGAPERNHDRLKSDTDKANDFDSNLPVILTKGTNSKRVLISLRSQPEAARALGWKHIVMIFGGLALALLSLCFLLEIKGLV